MNEYQEKFLSDMIERFGERAESIKKSNMPPLEGEMRLKWIRQRNVDYQDFAILADASGHIDEGVLHLYIDLGGDDAP